MISLLRNAWKARMTVCGTPIYSRAIATISPLPPFSQQVPPIIDS
jgi:hypothetical protein